MMRVQKHGLKAVKAGFKPCFYPKHAFMLTSSVYTVQCTLAHMYVRMYFVESRFYSNRASVSRSASKNRLPF